MKFSVIALMFLAFIAIGGGAGNVYAYQWGRAIVWFALMFIGLFAAVVVAIYDTRQRPSTQ